MISHQDNKGESQDVYPNNVTLVGRICHIRQGRDRVTLPMLCKARGLPSSLGINVSLNEGLRHTCVIVGLLSGLVRVGDRRGVESPEAGDDEAATDGRGAVIDAG
jgi:hypothetical protein